MYAKRRTQTLLGRDCERSEAKTEERYTPGTRTSVAIMAKKADIITWFGAKNREVWKCEEQEIAGTCECVESFPTLPAPILRLAGRRLIRSCVGCSTEIAAIPMLSAGGILIDLGQV